MSEERKEGKKKAKYRVKINHELCKLCDICVQLCPVKDLKINDQKLIELGKCIGCMLCERNCPDLAIEVEKVEEGEDEPRTKS